MKRQFFTRVKGPFFVEKVTIMKRRWENINYSWDFNEQNVNFQLLSHRLKLFHYYVKGVFTQ